MALPHPAYFAALPRSGFAVTCLREPQMTRERASGHPTTERWSCTPNSLQVLTNYGPSASPSPSIGSIAAWRRALAHDGADRGGVHLGRPAYQPGDRHVQWGGCVLVPLLRL
jgi:hypothetical protein